MPTGCEKRHKIINIKYKIIFLKLIYLIQIRDIKEKIDANSSEPLEK
tara:strand:+ start:658 stop:798 length:141 start_codon:yes stop_codon:yes gene_type:complete